MSLTKSSITTLRHKKSHNLTWFANTDIYGTNSSDIKCQMEQFQ